MLMRKRFRVSKVIQLDGQISGLSRWFFQLRLWKFPPSACLTRRENIFYIFHADLWKVFTTKTKKYKYIVHFGGSDNAGHKQLQPALRSLSHDAVSTVMAKSCLLLCRVIFAFTLDDSRRQYLSAVSHSVWIGSKYHQYGLAPINQKKRSYNRLTFGRTTRR
ncbi:hypothetical protein AVEN_85948-1 [Araneus ventricosus]|uniref:Uncharacterized protein n=1 Tax=Araneus ventricosus TaxID=182803 RepID=A0A4Y2NTX5_ARAVE|nr:hypothetical protein AVEN_85948-1 [Araneus ventricosus]